MNFFLLPLHVCVLSCFSWDQLFVMLWTVAHQAPLWNSPGKNTGASSLPFSPPGDLPNPEIEPVSSGAPALQADSVPLGHQGSPRILEWVVIPFSRGSSGPRDWIQASHIAERFFTIWATREQRYYLTMWTLDLTKWISLSKKYEQTWWEQELQMGFYDLSLEEHDLSNSPSGRTLKHTEEIWAHSSLKPSPGDQQPEAELWAK